jgi:hypothetical protein
MNMNNVYETPQIEILVVEVEKGYFGSITDYDEEEFEWD